MLVLLSTVAATTALVSQQLTVSRAENAVPNEGFYWSVAQYQIAHYRLKQELRAVAAGEPVNASELSRRAAVLASRVSILTEPSEVKSLLDGVPGYADATRTVAELQRRVGPILEKGALTQADAIKVLGDFKAAGDDALLSTLANDASIAELNAKEAMTQSLSQHIGWIWGGYAFSWTALVLWLLDGRIMLVSAVCRFSTTMAPPQSATVLALSVQLVPPEQTLRLVPNSVTDPASTARMACRCCKTLMVLAG